MSLTTKLIGLVTKLITCQIGSHLWPSGGKTWVSLTGPLAHLCIAPIEVLPATFFLDRAGSPKPSHPWGGSIPGCVIARTAAAATASLRARGVLWAAQGAGACPFQLALADHPREGQGLRPQAPELSPGSTKHAAGRLQECHLSGPQLLHL